MRATVAVVVVVLSVVAAQYFQNPQTTRGWFGATGPCGGGYYEYENKPNFYFYEGDAKTIQYYLYSIADPSQFDLTLHKYGTDSITETLPPTQYGWQIDEYRELAGGTIADLKENEDYPLYPDSRNYLGNVEYNSPDNGALGITTSYVGHRAWGLYLATQTGVHRFYISGDDNAELYMSTTPYASSSRRICYARESGYQVYDSSSSQKSGAIDLIAGETYYMEVLHAQSEGDNYFSTMIEYPDATTATLWGYYSYNGPSGLYKIVKTNYIYDDSPLDSETTGSHLLEVTMPSGSKCDYCSLGYSYADANYACTDIVVFSHDDDYQVTFHIDASTGSVLLPETFRTRFLNIFTEELGYYEDENVWFPEEEFTVSGDSYQATVRVGNSIEYTAHDLALYTVRYEDLTGLGVTVLDVTYGEASAFGLVPSVFTAIVAVAGLMWQLL